jgi:hypothetical protein
MWKEFEKLPVFEGTLNSASALKVDSDGIVVLCKDGNGGPFYLVRVGPDNSRPSFRLRYVTFIFDVVFEMNISDSVVTDTCVKVSCDDEDIFRRKVFVESISAVVSQCVEIEPMALIDVLVQLFSRAPGDATRSELGLWGELLFIYSRENSDEAVLAWHSDPNQLRDFVFREHAVEVKTTSAGQRVHHFSLPQIATAHAGDLLCSVMVESTDSGHSVSDLATMIDTKCTVNTKAAFWSKFLLTVDKIHETKFTQRFSVERALHSIRFYELAELSRPDIGELKIGRMEDVKFSLVL